MRITRTKILVYKTTGHSPNNTTDNSIVQLNDRHPDIHSKIMTKEIIKHYFHNDSARRRVFLSFLRKGFIGLLLYSDKEWIGYGWMSTLEHNHPPHFPKYIVPERGFWIFYCHTLEKYRGQGLYKRVLTELKQIASLTSQNPELYIDTDEDNRISQKGILATGFELIGTVGSRYFILFDTWLHLKSKWGESN
ncbi:GNAT family N-acetyltransferase [Paenibacillus albiflavus]|uniref:GNAT family N-acetyltransferase n=1 Tax=Paenibacillus albiflavus TaxID=2545760 RepID=UPI001404FBB8|nr:GNAT family N-acetyltransferase [Paenibacillus albiflavus]